MKKIVPVLICSILLSGCIQKNASESLFLKVSENGRFLEEKNGTPFLYLGCTAWELFHKLNREEASEYLKNRAEKGFTVIQAVVLAELDGVRKPNSYGELPLINENPETPNEKYFEHVDYIVNEAEKLGLYIGMLPTWGDKVTAENGGEPVIFNSNNAKSFGEYLGKRYKNKPIIWILGGDRNITNDTVLNIWRSMAKGLKIGDEGNHLITFHPRGGASSSYWLHNEDWLDFNLYQSGHTQHYTKVYEFATNDYMLHPAKPFVDGEPPYEDISPKFWEYLNWNDSIKVPDSVLDKDNLIVDKSHFKSGFFTSYDIRVHAYWDLLSGACGYTYGNNAVWQMFKKGGSFMIPCLFDWRESMNRPGSFSIRHIRTLFTARSFSKLIPDQSVVYGSNPNDSTHIRSAVANDGSFLIAYLALGQKVEIVTKKIASQKIKAWWYNPREGMATIIGEFENTGAQTFVPPSSRKDNDWVLVLDDISKNYPIPGMNMNK